MKHQARKRFGQNFLHDGSVIQRIVAAIQPKPDDNLVEIGPGLGALTLPILKQVGKLNVVELDRDIIPKLQAETAGHGDLEIYSADALKFDFGQLCRPDKPLRVYGNLPYNISTPLIFHLFEFSDQIQDMHFMLQKEVVDRMVADPGSKQYGRLSVMTQYFSQAMWLFDVPPGAFRPAPKVTSAIVRLKPYRDIANPVQDVKKLQQIVTTAFNYRRKTLRNALKDWLTEDELVALDIDPGQRPERLTLNDFVRICNHHS